MRLEATIKQTKLTIWKEIKVWARVWTCSLKRITMWSTINLKKLTQLFLERSMTMPIQLHLQTQLKSQIQIDQKDLFKWCQATCRKRKKGHQFSRKWTLVKWSTSIKCLSTSNRNKIFVSVQFDLQLSGFCLPYPLCFHC